jgi:hypothetical protein
MIILLCIECYSTSSTDTCETDEDCLELNYCSPEKRCKHKGIFPMNLMVIIGLIFICFGSALSNAGGIGGGGLLIPILLLLLNFYTHEAIPISKLMIFTGALTSFIMGFRQTHPTRKSITIDYNIPLLLVPFLLFGTMVGVTLNKVFPPWLILTSLTICLVINTYKTLRKAIDLYRKENKDVTVIKAREIEINDSLKKNNQLFEESTSSETTSNNSKSISSENFEVLDLESFKSKD